MEEQKASLAHVLLKDPTLDLDGAVADFRLRLERAIHPISDAVSVQVTQHEDSVTFTPELNGADPALCDALVAEVYQVKSDWIRDLNTQADR